MEEVLFIPLTALQADVYRALLRSKDVKRLLNSAGGNEALSLQCINQLKKLANHPGKATVSSARGPACVSRMLNILHAFVCCAALVYDECRKAVGAEEPKSALSFYPEVRLCCL